MKNLTKRASALLLTLLGGGFIISSPSKTHSYW